jgi:hypothetical protein
MEVSIKPVNSLNQAIEINSDPYHLFFLSTVDRHGHIRGSIAPDSGNLLDMDFTDELTGKTALNRKEVARLKAHMRSMAYSWSGLDPLKMFALVDDDHNGLLDKDEFYLVMKRVAGSFRGHDAEEATKRLRKIGKSILK